MELRSYTHSDFSDTPCRPSGFIGGHDNKTVCSSHTVRGCCAWGSRCVRRRCPMSRHMSSWSPGCPLFGTIFRMYIYDGAAYCSTSEGGHQTIRTVMNTEWVQDGDKGGLAAPQTRRGRASTTHLQDGVLEQPGRRLRRSRRGVGGQLLTQANH